jgi:hypothetical protein
MSVCSVKSTIPFSAIDFLSYTHVSIISADLQSLIPLNATLYRQSSPVTPNTATSEMFPSLILLHQSLLAVLVED